MKPFRRVWDWIMEPVNGEEIKLRPIHEPVSYPLDDEYAALASSEAGAGFAWAWYSMVRSKAECEQLDCFSCLIVDDVAENGLAWPS